MKLQEITIRGKVDNTGELRIFAKRDYDKFVKRVYTESDQEGCDILMTLTVMPKNGKQKRIAYIKKAIYPQFKRAFGEHGMRMTKDQIENKINQMTAVCRGRNIQDLDWNELGEFIDETKEIAAEHFHFVIEDSIVI